MIRQPICVFMGHVDHGKTSLQDRIRHTAVAKSEAGAITQMISSSAVSIETVKRICGNLIKDPSTLTVPGLLFIDTPGHAAFTNLRKRGGNLADIAVLVIDVNEGIMPQTAESIEILKQYKTPFIIALNKIDLLQGWKKKEIPLLQLVEEQADNVKQLLDTGLYELVGKLYDIGINADRFDRVSDFTKQVAIIPCSAETGTGIPEMLMVLVGLAQKFLEESLKTTMDAGKATVLEVKEEKGIGKVLDAILYDGVLKQGDAIAIGDPDGAIITKIRGIFIPEKGKLKSVTEISAAAGIRISAPDIEKVIPGVPLASAGKDIEKAKEDVQKEVEAVMLDTDNEGVVVKADSLGSLEALLKMLREKKIPVKKGSVGTITKKDLADASSEDNPYYKVLLAFNVPADEEKADVKIISHNVIYTIIEDYEKWLAEEKKRQEKKALEALTMPAKMQILRKCIFRQSNPAVVGVLVLGGVVKADVDLIKADGSNAGTIKAIQMEKETVEKAEKGKEVAISLPGITAGRQIDEDDILYADVPERDFKELKKYKNLLKEEDIKLLKELAEIKRKQNSLWGV
ncbi:MAG: translation initiation factor IF-2 [Nanoarchaeota archaeon]|nr:translation initiation factor IF-2 [Nanoarchaeota archaeon]